MQTSTKKNVYVETIFSVKGELNYINITCSSGVEEFLPQLKARNSSDLDVPDLKARANTTHVEEDRRSSIN